MCGARLGESRVMCRPAAYKYVSSDPDGVPIALAGVSARLSHATELTEPTIRRDLSILSIVSPPCQNRSWPASTPFHATEATRATKERRNGRFRLVSPCLSGVPADMMPAVASRY